LRETDKKRDRREEVKKEKEERWLVYLEVS